jgi:LCP family protein required for cell wall assembly
MNTLRSRTRNPKVAPSIVRHGKQTSPGPVSTIAKVVAVAVAVALVSATSVAAIAAWDVSNSVKPSVHLVGEKTAAPAPALGVIPQIGAIDGGVNLLLVGSDSRQGQDPVFGTGKDAAGVLNDVTMLLHISKDHTNATVVSFPRDMFVSIPSCPDPKGGHFSSMTSQKINTTLTYGGLPCTVLTVSKLTGLDIPYAAMIQFSGVMAMSTAVGGVPVCVAEKIEDKYTGTFLDPGMHTLSGYAALQFLRTRHGVGDGSDLGRISNQQVFLSSLMRTIKSADTLSNPIKLYALAKAAVSNMTVSQSLNNVNTMVQIALALKDISLDKVVFIQYPTGYVAGGGGVEPIPSAATALMTAIKADQPVALSGGTGPGQIGSVVESPAPVPTPATSGTTAPTAPAAGAAVTVLPSQVTGQTAAEQTCSKGRTLKQQ